VGRSTGDYLRYAIPAGGMHLANQERVPHPLGFGLAKGAEVDFVFFLFLSRSLNPFNPPLRPFNPHFLPFTVKHLTLPYWYDIV
jgi:hypothetical protein